MNEQLSSNDVAKRLGVSQRQARRLILANDSRLDPLRHEEFVAISRNRVAGKLFTEATNLSASWQRLTHATDAESFNEGPEVERLKALRVRLNVLAGELYTLSEEMRPQ